MGLGAEIDRPLPAVMLRLVALRRVEPNSPGRVDVARSASWQTSPGRIPVSRCSSIIAQTCRETWGRTASTNASGTGRTGSGSRASARPLLRPETALRPWWTEGEINSDLDGPLERPDDRPTRRLISVRQSPESIIAWRTALSARRAEFLGQRVAVELAERPEAEPEQGRLLRRLAVLPVVAVREVEVGDAATR